MNGNTVSNAKPKSVALAFGVAGFISAALFASYTFLTDTSQLQGPAYAAALLLVGLEFSCLALLVLAAPLFLILRRFRLVNPWMTLAAGLTIGMVMGYLTERPQTGLSAFSRMDWSDHAVRRTCAFALIGAVSALGFWLTINWPFGLTPNQRLERPVTPRSDAP